MMAELERMILEARGWRRQYRAMVPRHKYQIEACCCAIREKALCDARAAIVGRAEPPFVFRPVLEG